MEFLGEVDTRPLPLRAGEWYFSTAERTAYLCPLDDAEASGLLDGSAVAVIAVGRWRTAVACVGGWWEARVPLVGVEDARAGSGAAF